MKVYGIVIGLAAILAAGSANASVVYDTISGLTETNQLKLLTMKNHAPLGDAFSAAVAETITSVTVQLNDPNATSTTFVNDTGSVLVYLVPDVGGLPSHSGTTLLGANFLGSILDSSLLGGGVANNMTLSTNLSIAAGNYWLMLTSGSDPNNFQGTQNLVASTAAWTNIATASAAGAPGLLSSGFVTAGVSGDGSTIVGGVDSTPGAPNNQVFLAQILTSAPTVGGAKDIPEPASLALLGAGLIGLGAGRGRGSKKTAA